MTAYEYLLANGEKYRPFPAHIPLRIMGNYTPFKIGNRLYCTGCMDFEGKRYGFFVDESMDGCITYGLNKSVEYQIRCDELRNVLRRLNKLFSDMITFAEFANPDTELVQLRIAVNMMHKLLDIEKFDRTQWVSWVLELFWNRKALLNKWYIENVLPF